MTNFDLKSSKKMLKCYLLLKTVFKYLLTLLYETRTIYISAQPQTYALKQRKNFSFDFNSKEILYMILYMIDK